MSLVHEVRKHITISVEDINDNPPLISTNYTFIVNEASPVGTVIGTIISVDADVSIAGFNALIQYRIDPSTNPLTEFIVDSLFGYIIINKKLDRETTSTYCFDVIAYDNGNPRLHSVSPVNIIIADDDDNKPRFLTLKEEIYLNEDVPLGTLITVSKYEDADVGPNAAVIFDIISGNEDGWFRINPITGHIFVMRELDYETTNNFTLNISMVALTGKFPPSYR